MVLIGRLSADIWRLDNLLLMHFSPTKLDLKLGQIDTTSDQRFLSKNEAMKPYLNNVFLYKKNIVQPL